MKLYSNRIVTHSLIKKLNYAMKLYKYVYYIREQYIFYVHNKLVKLLKTK